MILKIDQKTAQSGAVLGRRRQVIRKCRRDGAAAGRAGFDFALILSDVEVWLRQVNALPAFIPDDRLVGQIGIAGTGVKGESDQVVRVCHRLQGMAEMSFLSTRLVPGRCAQALGAGLSRAIGRGRFAAVSAVCVESLFQFADLRGQYLHLVRQCEDHLDEDLGIALGPAEECVAGAGHGWLRQRAWRKCRLSG